MQSVLYHHLGKLRSNRKLAICSRLMHLSCSATHPNLTSLVADEVAQGSPALRSAELPTKTFISPRSFGCDCAEPQDLGVIACHCCFRGVSYLLVSDWPKTFKEAFCERYRCPSDQYLRRAFRKCLYRRAVLLAPIIMAVSPAFFQVDMDVIERIGSARSWRELHAELRAFSINSRLRTRPLRSQFRLRVSGNRICKLAEVLFGPQKSSSGGR